MSATKREGIVYGLGEAEYHGFGAHKQYRYAEMSSTHAKALLKSPAKYHYARVNGISQEPKASFDVGTAAHTAILGVGAKTVVYPKEHWTPSGNVSTGAKTVAWAKEQRDAGFVPVSEEQERDVTGMKEAVLAHPIARHLLERAGHSEVSIFDEYLGVKRRGRFDYLPDGGDVAVDLKTAADASPNEFKYAAAKYGYHIQRGHYLHIMHQLGRDLDMRFIVVEKNAPYLVAVHCLDDQFAEMGEAEALEAVDTYRRCMDSGVWPGYEEKLHILPPPMGAVYDYSDRYESGEIQVA